MLSKRFALCYVSCVAACLAASTVLAQSATHPNIVYILADDMGTGDVRSYTNTSLGNDTPNSPVRTPNIDSLATAGMRFTNAHSPAANCTPTRYGVLTGRYCWEVSRKLLKLEGGLPMGDNRPSQFSSFSRRR